MSSSKGKFFTIKIFRNFVAVSTVFLEILVLTKIYPLISTDPQRTISVVRTCGDLILKILQALLPGFGLYQGLASLEIF
jgi:hypothetical protein